MGIGPQLGRSMRSSARKTRVITCGMVLAMVASACGGGKSGAGSGRSRATSGDARGESGRVPTTCASKAAWRWASVNLAAMLLFVPATGVGAHANALAKQPTCGDTITADTVLAVDLVNCPNNGIVIGADNITLDLNGHTIDGNARLVESCPADEFCDFGISNMGHEGVSVEGGSVRDFALDVIVLDAAHNAMHDMSVSNSFFPGVVIAQSTGSRVQRTSIFRNGLTTDQAGLVVFDSERLQIERNSIYANGDIGMFLVESEANRIENNRFSDNPEAGMIVEGNENEVLRNHLVRNGDNIIVSGNRNTIARNRAFDAVGCREGCGFGISFEGGRHNLIVGNLVARAHESTIRVGFGGKHNLMRRNLVRDARHDGVLIESSAGGILLERNLAIGAGDDGFDIESPATTLTMNHAVHNSDHGIEAVAGVTDGGGNKASGNGNPLECTNVMCK
jgi:large repetitive protein